MKKTYTLAALLLISTLGIAFAASSAATQITGGLNDLNGVVTTFNKGIVSSLATMFATLAMVAFFWGIVQFIWGVRQGQQQVITDGKKFMGWGLIALFVMFSVWGIIIFAQKIFGIDGNNTIIIPSIQLQGSSSATNPSVNGLPSSQGVNGGSLCPDGVTRYFNNDSSTCPSATATINAQNATVQNTSNSTTACDGIASETARQACLDRQNANNTSANIQPLGYCPDGSPYYNQSDAKFCPQATCSSYKDANSCTSNGCSWNNTYGCSQ